MLMTVTSFPYPVRVIENLFVPMPDGTRLAAKMWLPDGGHERIPALIEYLPYRKRDGTRTRDQGIHQYFAGHGYASIRLDIRGSGDSEGLIDDEYSEQEQRDGCAAIAWIAGQAWCDGQCAMFGISWGGFNALQIAARQPPALKTIITVGSTDDRYATDIHWVGGCLSKDNFDWSATLFAHNDLPPDPAITGAAWRGMWQRRIEHNTPWILKWLKHQRRDACWKQGSVCEDFARIKVPVYAVSGWADNYSESVPRLLAGLTCPRKGLIGPWAHSWPHDVTVEPAIGWLQEALRWFDHWLKGRDTGVMREPMYRVWMQDSVPPQTCYPARPGRWVAETIGWESPQKIAFTLRDGLKWKNGFGPVTAADVKFSFERIAGSSSAWAYQFEKLDRVEVIDARSGIIHLKQPFKPFWIITLPYYGGHIVCKAAVEKAGGSYTTEIPAQCGPFLMEKWEQNQKVTLAANPDWNGARPAFDRIEIFIVTDDQAALLAYEADAYDFSRLADGRLGGWYASFDAATAIAETLYHHTRRLGLSDGGFPNRIEMRELIAAVDTNLVDLRGERGARPELHHPTDYSASQAFATALRWPQTGAPANGIVFASLRRPGGTNLSLFRLSLVKRPVTQGGHYEYAWSARGEAEARRLTTVQAQSTE